MYVPVSGLMFAVGICLGAYLVYLIGFKRGLDQQIMLGEHSDNEWDVYVAQLDAADWATANLEERVAELEGWNACLGKLGKTSLPCFDDLVERVKALEIVAAASV